MKNRSAICCIAKDEDRVLLDWILFHLYIGVEHVYIYDDCSLHPIADKILTLPEVLRTRVSVLRLPGDLYAEPDKFIASGLYDEEIFKRWLKSKQRYVYNLFLKQYGHLTEWVAFIDLDEFIWPGEYLNLDAFLDELDASSVSAVVLNMVFYGHNYKVVPYEGSPLLHNFRRMRKLWGHGKMMVKPEVVKVVGNPHMITLNPGYKTVDVSLKEQESEFFETSHIYNGTADLSAIPHLKHYIDFDIHTSISRRIRGRVNGVGGGFDRVVADRISFFDFSNVVVDLSMVNAYSVFAPILGVSPLDIHAALHDDLSESLDNRLPLLDFTSYIEHYSLAADIRAIDLYVHFVRDNSDRIIPDFLKLAPDFACASYRRLNPDLRNLTDEELCVHYYKRGKIESRKFKDE